MPISSGACWEGVGVCSPRRLQRIVDDGLLTDELSTDELSTDRLLTDRLLTGRLCWC